MRATEPNRKSDAAVARGEYDYWWFVIGVGCSAISLISLLQKMFGVGLAPVLGELLNFYRKLFHFPFDLIAETLPFQLRIPDWYKDAYVLSFIELTAHLRAESKMGKVLFSNDRFSRTAITVTYPFVLSIPLLGLFMLMLTVSLIVARPTLRPNRDDNDKVKVGLLRHRYHVISWLAVLVAALVFFALNSQF